MRLVDPAQPFQMVYAIYHHEYLGYLISAHVVQDLFEGQLSLVHQGVYPDNMRAFDSGLASDDYELINLLNEITPKEIIKRFGGNYREPHAFFTGKLIGEVKKLVNAFIQRHLSKALPMLWDKELYEMGNDGYPAQKGVKMLSEKASILFHFRRKETFTRYFPTIKLRDEKIEFQHQGAAIICSAPAWMLLNGELFTFKEKLDGNKLRPFIKKDFIAIPREKEEEYYRKFVTQIVEKYDVFAKGFDITDVRESPTFSLLVKEQGDTALSFIREISYGRFRFPFKEEGRKKAIMEFGGDEYRFFRIFRDCRQEAEIRNALEKIAPQPNALNTWEYVPKELGLGWLSTHTASLQAMGIKVEQEGVAHTINLDRPEIMISTVEEGDWFDIKAIVVIGEFQIPFIKFRKHILRNQREYQLPDGSIAILPDDWFSDYQHLLEVSEEKSEEVFSIRKYQAPLLNFPSNGNKKALVSTIDGIDRVAEVAAPVHLNATLRSYQARGLDWLCFMKEHGMGGILADDMGLGKTLQTLSLLQKEKEAGVDSPSLIIMPTSLISNWKNEICRFTDQLQVHIHTGVNRKRDVAFFTDFDVILTTYGIARQDIRFLKTFPFHYVILDESQMIKNPESKTAKAVKKLVSRHRLSLTGTPIENSVMDIWSQMSFLNPGLLGNESFFKKFYVQPIEKDKDPKRSAKLKRIIYPFILRRKKRQVEKDLPPKIEKLHYCELVDSQQELYEETRSSYRNYLMELINKGTWKRNKLNILTGLQKLRQIAIHPMMVDRENYSLEDSGKYREIKRMLKTVLRKRSKVLIFSQFVKMLHLLRDDLIEEGIRFNYLDGSTRNRQEQVDTFQEDKSIQVFLISLKAGGVGLNLTAADYVFILDPWWNPAVENQAVDRSHRIGQQKTVFYYKFITQGSIEEKILQLQKRKSQLSDDIIAVEEDIYKSLNEDDLGDLLGSD